MPFIPYDKFEVGRTYEIDRANIPANRGDLRSLVDVIRETPSILYIEFVGTDENFGPRNLRVYNVRFLDDKKNPVSTDEIRRMVKNKFLRRDAERIPFIDEVAKTISSKAKYQAIKEVLGSRGLPDTVESGIGMFLPPDVKAPPKQTGLGKRKTRRRITKKKTRRH